jgi:hypothetical protein
VKGTEGRVTGKIGPGLVGEVMLPVRGGVEAFYAYAEIEGEVIPIGARVVVTSYQQPRTVYVALATPFGPLS